MANNEAKTPLQSKTMKIGIVTLVLSILAEIIPVVQQYVDLEVTRTAMIGGIVMMIMRAVTNSPLIFKPKK